MSPVRSLRLPIIAKRERRIAAFQSGAQRFARQGVHLFGARTAQNKTGQTSNGVRLKKSFFIRPTLRVSKELLGKYLVRRHGAKTISLMITEVEAYVGQTDMACHASRGKTERNKVMFDEGGRWYVYFTYGMHWMLNIATGPQDYPAAVLIRGTDKVKGPGRLTKYLKIDKRFNGSLADRKSGLWIEDRGYKIKPSEIIKTPRIGVDYAGPIWAAKPWRFYLRH